MQDRVSVATVELIEVAFGVCIAIEGGLEIFRDRRFALRRIGGLPSAIELGLLDLPHPGRPHAAERDQSERPLAIDLGPLSLWTAGREADQPMVGVELVELPVNPSAAEGTVDCFLLRDARNAGRCLG
jgi:hypothetical protein